jgi:hypothetical protein
LSCRNFANLDGSFVDLKSSFDFMDRFPFSLVATIFEGTGVRSMFVLDAFSFNVF